MSFLNKFKNKKAEDQVPEGVKVENSSFGQPQAGYNPGLVQQNITSNQSSQQNGNHSNNSNKQQTGSFAQTSVWNDDQPTQLNNTAPKQAKGKPNFMQKNVPQQQPAPVQQVQQTTQVQKPAPAVAAQRQEINLKIDNPPVAKKIKFEIKNEFDLLDDNDLNFPELEYQKKLVNDIVAPGGIRIKQQEDILSTFAEDCQAFHPCVIGSLLINKFFSNEQTIVKQRAIYASEILVKRHQKFQEYFKRQQFMVQKSQQFNISDSKFAQLSNQLLAVVSNPTLEIKEQADINFNFSQGSDLSKFSKKNEQQQQQAQQQSATQQRNNQAPSVNLIDDDVNDQNGIDLLADQQQTQTKSKSLFNNLNKKKNTESQAPAPQIQSQVPQVQQIQQQPQPTQSTNGESKMKQFLKFKSKQNNENNQNNLNKDGGDLLNLIDDQIAPSNGKSNTSNNHQDLSNKFSLLNLYGNEKESQNHNQIYNNYQYPNQNINPPQFNQFNPHIQQTGLYPPQYPQPGFNGQVPQYPYQNNGYPQYPQQGYQPYGQQVQPNIYGYNNSSAPQNSQGFKTIHMDFTGQNSMHQDKQILDLNNFKIDENTPNKKNSQAEAQKSKQQINEGAFDFISL